MQDKIPVLLIYSVLGLVFALSPLLLAHASLAGSSTSRLSLSKRQTGYLVPTLAVALAVLLFTYTQAEALSPFFFAVLALCLCVAWLHKTSFKNAARGSSATLLACTVGTTLIWWRHPQAGVEISSSELLSFLALFVTSTSILLSKRFVKPTNRLENIISLGLYIVVIAYLSYSLATTVDPDIRLTLWHHWGAYIDPSELVMAGARLLHDIPAQYGAGPTLLIRATCSSDCWSAAYLVIGTTTFAYALLIGVIARLIAPSGGRYRNIVFLLLCIATCMFWNAYPPTVSSPNVTPSTNGLRFLPVVMLVAWLLFTANRNFTMRSTGGHILWILGAIWSPESLFYVTAVWWPVYLFDTTMLQSEQMNKFRRIVRAAYKLALLAVGTIIAACVSYYLIYGVLPVPRYLLIYMLYPPGPLPIDSRGAIWYFVLSMTLSVCVSWANWGKTGNVTQLRRSLILQLLAYSTFSYYLGRSHDNNLLNLMPFFMLMLLDTFAKAKDVFTRYAIAISLAFLLAWLPVFGWGAWLNAFHSGRLAEFDFSVTRANLAYSDKDTYAGILNRNKTISKEQLDQTIQLMDRLARTGESFVVLDQNFLLQPYFPARPWCAIQSATNFEFFPSVVRQDFLLRTANRFQRSGWLIIARNHNVNTWLADFDSAYNRTGRIDLDAVYAVRFSPKTTNRPG